MTRSTVMLSALVFGLGLSLLTPIPAEAQKDGCFVGCGMLSQGCVAGLRGGRSECKLACRETAPGRGRGECKRNCAHVPHEAKQECKITRDQCRAECDHPNACNFGCDATARECFTTKRNKARDCRLDCRTEAEEMAAACATADDPEACLEAVAEARGACLDLCSMQQGEDLAACGAMFAECRAACHPPDPNEPPDSNDPPEDPGGEDE